MSIATINPATGAVVKQFQSLSDAEIEKKIGLAQKTFKAWRNVKLADRAESLVRAAEILEKEKEAFGQLMTLEMGKLFREAAAEAEKCAWVCRYYAEHTGQFLADEPVDTGVSKSYVCYQPLGAVLAVMPWNYPFWQVLRFAAPALMAGNVGLLKHASNVPQSALAIEDLFRRAGIPEGAFQTLLVGSDKVDGILADPRIVAATLTGSDFAGVSVGVAAAKRVKKVVLELGGSDPFIVTPSADIEKAVQVGVKARVQNNGQSCIAAKRFIVVDQVYDRFKDQFVELMKSLKLADPFAPEAQLGPVATAAGRSELDADVRKTVEMGAQVLTGGKPADGPGNFYLPTVLADVPAGSPGDCAELFGPVACLFRARDAADAISIANRSPFGLGASVWTNDPAEQDLFIRDLEAGMVFVNRMVASDPRVPFGGVKRSGHGRELGGPHGIREFTNIKTVSIQ